jgi:hypothetical protein
MPLEASWGNRFRGQVHIPEVAEGPRLRVGRRAEVEEIRYVGFFRLVPGRLLAGLVGCLLTDQAKRLERAADGGRLLG